jgi:small-conductance mechanosensitive channel
MRDEENNSYNLSRLIIRPLYFGLVVNILIPAAGLLICHYIDSNYGWDNVIGNLANALFFIFIALALLQAVFSLWWRAKRLRRPMVRTKETFEQEMVTGLLRACRPVFIVIAAISVYGYLYFFLTGRFTETVVFIFFSFIVFQLVRPRHGFARKLVARQKGLLEQGMLVGRR